ncbi:hypothetical protein [Streptacidiphilus albus]|uniref:hypothetical protein n=1 Tax=Streptacidiphilus albus TaxID=105425 RepID=UPI00054C00BF|nr:hypothetical protein [Streptacidiphilus albus]
MTTSTARRAELAAFLRSRRARVAPEVSVAISGFVPASAPDTELIVHTPADGPSRERLRWLLAHAEAPFTDHVH